MMATRPDWSGTSAAVHLALMTSTILTAGYGRLRVGTRSRTRSGDGCRDGRGYRCRVARAARCRYALEVAAGARRRAAHEPLADEPAGASHRRICGHADIDHPPCRTDQRTYLRDACRHHSGPRRGPDRPAVRQPSRLAAQRDRRGFRDDRQPGGELRRRPADHRRHRRGRRTRSRADASNPAALRCHRMSASAKDDRWTWPTPPIRRAAKRRWCGRSARRSRG